MIIKIIIGILIYIFLITVILIFFKGATMVGNKFDKKREAEKFLKHFKEKKL